MVQRANSTKQLASAEKSTRKTLKSRSPPEPKSTERVGDSDMESDSDDSDSDTHEVGEQEAAAPTYTYEPPRDFTALPSDSLPDSHPFSARNLQGKELWFFTAPINAPMSRLRDISAQDILDGAPILETTSGRRYCLKTDDDVGEEGMAVMTPGSDGLYRAAGKPIARSLRVVESLPRPKKISKDRVPAAKPVRLQPEGLRMRYRPFGAVESTEENGIAASADAMDIGKDALGAEGEEGEGAEGEGTPGRRKKRPKFDSDKKNKKKKKHSSKGKEVEA